MVRSDNFVGFVDVFVLARRSWRRHALHVRHGIDQTSEKLVHGTDTHFLTDISLSSTLLKLFVTNMLPKLMFAFYSVVSFRRATKLG